MTLRESDIIRRDFDDGDRRILREMQRDSSRPVTQIAEAVGMSHAACWRRMQRLRAEGLILREVAVLDREKLGWDLEMFVFVKVSPHGRANIVEFRRSITQHEQIVGAYVLLGNVDVMLHVVARNVRDYNRFFLGTLSESPYISEINSMTVLSSLKETDFPV